MPHPRSHRRSLLRLPLCFFSALAILTILYFVILHYTGNGFLALFLLMGGLITLCSRHYYFTGSRDGLPSC